MEELLYDAVWHPRDHAVCAGAPCLGRCGAGAIAGVYDAAPWAWHPDRFGRRRRPEALEQRGVRLAAPFRSGRLHIWLGHSARDLDVVIEAEPEATGLVILDGPGPINFQVELRAQDHVLILSASENSRQGRANLWGTGTAVFFGAGGSSNFTSFMAEGDGVSIVVGDDAMFSEDVEIVTSDNHGIFEIADPSRLINAPASVVIHPHVWAGRSVTVNKGLSIGAGAILGRRSLVTRDVDKACAVGGIPARVLREGVSWIRPWAHYQPSVDAAMAMIEPREDPAAPQLVLVGKRVV